MLLRLQLVGLLFDCFIPAIFFTTAVANVAYWFNRICTRRIEEKKFRRVVENHMARKTLKRRGH